MGRKPRSSLVECSVSLIWIYSLESYTDWKDDFERLLYLALWGSWTSFSLGGVEGALLKVGIFFLCYISNKVCAFLLYVCVNIISA